MQNEEGTKQGKTHVPEAIQRNYILKVIDAKATDIKNALRSQDIKIIALAEVFNERVPFGEKTDNAS